MNSEQVVEAFRVKPGKKLRLKDHDPGWEGDSSIPRAERKETAKSILAQDVAALAESQELLYADNRWSVLAIFQATDAAGKDSTIKHVLSGVNPMGCQIFSFKQPSAEELDHDFLWRCVKALPERGRIGVFNRSYYEEVLIARVHPELLAAQRLPDAKPTQGFWKRRYEDINNFEQHLTRSGTKIVKFFLHLSKDEQGRRFIRRLEHPEKHWKFSLGDFGERALWDEYQQAYEKCLAATSTDEAPWYVIPADHKWVTRALVATALLQTIRSLPLQWPKINRQQQSEIAAARKKLEKGKI